MWQSILFSTCFVLELHGSHITWLFVKIHKVMFVQNFLFTSYAFGHENCQPGNLQDPFWVIVSWRSVTMADHGQIPEISEMDPYIPQMDTYKHTQRQSHLSGRPNNLKGCNCVCVTLTFISQLILQTFCGYINQHCCVLYKGKYDLLSNMN